jgi:hypothetical protein
MIKCVCHHSSKGIVVPAAALVIFGVACQVADRHKGASATSQQSTVDLRMEELKYSQFCAEAAEKFWGRHDWKNQQDLHEIVSYRSRA